MQLRYNVATSLDGFIAPPDESTGWITEDPSIDFDALYASFDVFIMGRKTYEIIACSPEGNPLKGQPKERVIVISRSFSASDHPDITIIGEGFLEHIAKVKQQGHRGWLMGGGWLAAACLDAGLLDAIDAAIMPVLLGSGFKLISDRRKELAAVYKLSLRSLERLDSGILMTQYDVLCG